MLAVAIFQGACRLLVHVRQSVGTSMCSRKATKMEVIAAAGAANFNVWTKFGLCQCAPVLCILLCSSAATTAQWLLSMCSALCLCRMRLANFAITL